MQIDSKTLLCRYRYDALNRLVANTPSAQADSQRFYLNDRLVTEIHGAEQCSIMQHEDQLLAQQQRQSGTVETRLLATDQQRSVVNIAAAARRTPFTYTPYGHHHPQNGLLSLLGFNGERPDPVTGWYFLGNGYRAFNPVLMRFNNPDSWSPFGEGGLNAYAYCIGDPINRSDQSGHMFSPTRMPKLPAITRTPLANSTKRVQYLLQDGKYKDWKSISNDIDTYVDTYKEQPRLNFVAHGTPTPRFKQSRIPNGANSLDAEGLHTLTNKKGIDFNDYKNIRLITCHSANGGTGSIAADLSKITGLPVKGYRGTVTAAGNLKSIIDYNVNEVNRLSAPPNVPFRIFAPNGVIKSFPYDAVTFIRGNPVPQ